VVLGARISALLGVPHRVASPKKAPNSDDLVVKHPLLRAWEIIRATEGMVSVQNNVGIPVPFRIAPTIAGWGGEQMRGGYLALLFKRASSTPPAGAMRKKLGNLFTGLAGLLTGAANYRAATDLATWGDRAHSDPAQLLDLAYLYFRTGRWVSAYGGARWATLNPFNPLLDNLVTRHFLGIPPLVRWSEQPVHEVIGQLAPTLRDLPLQGTRWRYDERKPRWPFARRGWSCRYALRAETERARFDWRFQPSPLLVAILREQILDAPPQLFDVVNRNEMEALLATSPLESPKLVWHAYTASVLLSNAWLSQKPDRSPIAIRPPG